MIIGLTGSFGSGKTTVAKIFKSFGARIIDADRIAHSLFKPGTKNYKSVVRAFGCGILRKNKTINRNKLGEIVFSDVSLLRLLNKIVHPDIIRIIKNEIKKHSQGIVVLDAPLLIEAGFSKSVDRLIVVKLDKKRQIARLLDNTPLKKQEIVKRINAQMPLQEKVRLADFVIDNNNGVNDTRKQVIAIWKQLQLRMAQE